MTRPPQRPRPNLMDTQAVRAYLLDLLDRITTAAGALVGGTFATDSWE